MTATLNASLDEWYFHRDTIFLLCAATLKATELHAYDAQSPTSPLPRFAHTMAAVYNNHSNMVRTHLVVLLQHISHAPRYMPRGIVACWAFDLCIPNGMQDVVVIAGVNPAKDLNEVAVWRPTLNQPPPSPSLKA